MLLLLLMLCPLFQIQYVAIYDPEVDSTSNCDKDDTQTDGHDDDGGTKDSPTAQENSANAVENSEYQASYHKERRSLRIRKRKESRQNTSNGDGKTVTTEYQKDVTRCSETGQITFSKTPKNAELVRDMDLFDLCNPWSDSGRNNNYDPNGDEIEEIDANSAFNTKDDALGPKHARKSSTTSAGPSAAGMPIGADCTKSLDDAGSMGSSKIINDGSMEGNGTDQLLSGFRDDGDENNNNFVPISKLMEQLPESANFEWINADTLKNTASFLHCRQQLDEIVGWNGDTFCQQRKVSKVVTKVSKMEKATTKSSKKQKKKESGPTSDCDSKKKKVPTMHTKPQQQEKRKRKTSKCRNEKEGKSSTALVKFQQEKETEGKQKNTVTKSMKAIENGKSDGSKLVVVELTPEEQKNVVWKCFMKKGMKNGLRKNGNQNGYRYKIVECRMCDFTCRYAKNSASDTIKLMETHLGEKHNVDTIQIEVNRKDAENMKEKMKKMNLRSVVWEFFVIKEQNDEGRILSTMCSLCGFIGKHPGDSSTRVMRNHLHWAHKAELKNTKDKS